MFVKQLRKKEKELLLPPCAESTCSCLSACEHVAIVFRNRRTAWRQALPTVALCNHPFSISCWNLVSWLSDHEAGVHVMVTYGPKIASFYHFGICIGFMPLQNFQLCLLFQWQRLFYILPPAEARSIGGTKPSSKHKHRVFFIPNSTNTPYWTLWRFSRLLLASVWRSSSLQAAVTQILRLRCRCQDRSPRFYACAVLRVCSADHRIHHLEAFSWSLLSICRYFAYSTDAHSFPCGISEKIHAKKYHKDLTKRKQ